MADNGSDRSGNMAAIPSLSRLRLADQIANVMREQMLTGALPPGHAIHERETSSALGVSRTPLREALLILEAEGLIRTSPARSPIVADPTLSDLTQLLVVQASLESLAGVLACANASDKEIRDIGRMHEDMRVSYDDPDTVSHFRADMAFHEAIVRASGNQPLVKTHKQYNSRLWRARYMSSRERLGWETTADQHRQMVEGLENRNGAATAAVMRSHLENAIINITQIARGESPDNKQ